MKRLGHALPVTSTRVIGLRGWGRSCANTNGTCGVKAAVQRLLLIREQTATYISAFRTKTHPSVTLIFIYLYIFFVAASRRAGTSLRWTRQITFPSCYFHGWMDWLRLTPPWWRRLSGEVWRGETKNMCVFSHPARSMWRSNVLLVCVYVGEKGLLLSGALGQWIKDALRITRHDTFTTFTLL